MATARSKRGAPTRKTAGARGDLPPVADLKRTLVIENVAPTVDGGRYSVKRLERALSVGSASTPRLATRFT